MWVNAEMNASDAFVALWLPGSEGDAVADLLFTKQNGEINHDFTGKLSFSWPASADQTEINHLDENYQPLLPFGFGLSYGDKNTLADNLPVSIATSSKTLQAITLFESSVKAPWKMMIADQASTDVMTSSIIENNAVYLRTIDRDIQEDARRVKFTGGEKGSVFFTSNYAIDLTQYKNAESTMTITVRLSEKFTPSNEQAINLSMLCGEGCRGDIDISQTLAALAPQQWHELVVDLQCFETQGADLRNIFTPFSINTDAKLSVDFTDVAIVPNSKATVNVDCQ
jgi:beta-glucosidase